MSIAADEEAALARDVRVRAAQILAAECTTCGAGPGELCTDMCGWPVLEPVTRPVGQSHDARLRRAMPGLAELTRAEAAYAQLATFRAGEHVIVSGRRFAHVGTVTTAQQDGDRIEEAFLIVTGLAGFESPGGPRPLSVTVTVADMLDGPCLTVVAETDAGTGQWPYFDAATWAMRNQEP